VRTGAMLIEEARQDVHRDVGTGESDNSLLRRIGNATNRTGNPVSGLTPMSVTTSDRVAFAAL
jgi:hypothetical protein